MSTPIETNTEKLQEILQTVYNLPMAGGGSAEPDLVITPTEDFSFNTVNINRNNNISKVSFDPSAVISTYEKLIAGKDVRVVFAGRVYLNSYSPAFMTAYPAIRVLAYGTEMEDINVEVPALVVRFQCATGYHFLSGDGATQGVEYRFWINYDTGEVTLTATALWT